MTDTKVLRLQVARAQLEAIEHQREARRAYLRGAYRVEITKRFLRIGAAFAAGVVTCQVAHLVLL